MGCRVTRGLSWLGCLVLGVVGCQQEPADSPSAQEKPAATDVVEADAAPEKISAETSAAKPVRESTVKVDVNARRPARKLSDYGLFEDLEKQIPAAGVIPYEMNSLSFVDSARSESFIYIPPGQSAGYRAEDVAFDFPVGTILVQNIRFPADERDASQGNRLVETRLLIHGSKGWVAVPYLWNDEGTDADRAVIGDKTDVTMTLANGDAHSLTYLTPNMNECKRCHVNEDVLIPIGVTAANLNRDIEADGATVNQLVHWQSMGLLEGLPEDHASIPHLPDWHDGSVATVERRARSWLDVNCSHCHNPRGAASTSGLDLTFMQNEPVRYGVYKPPVAAGRGSQGLKFSILPQKPDESFMVRRIASVELGVMMPPLGRTTVDHPGVELIRQWITEMEIDDAARKIAEDPMGYYKVALEGTGDVERGKEVFHKKQKCISCHRVGTEGGSVGPNLSDIGKREKREYLLESIAAPSAKIAKGFETQVLILMSGQVVTGTVQSEDEYEVVISDAQNQHKIKKEDIDLREPSDVSTMPTLAGLLTIDDVRDLIAYLSTLQDTPPK